MPLRIVWNWIQRIRHSRRMPARCSNSSEEDIELKCSVLIAAIVELAVVAFFVAARDDGWDAASNGWNSASNPDALLLRVQSEVWPGGMPDGARNPQFGRISGAGGVDFVVGHGIPRVQGQDPSGRLRVYTHAGAAASPSFKNGFWLDDRIPSARIPAG
jgi:hypothetical protein